MRENCRHIRHNNIFINKIGKTFRTILFAKNSSPTLIWRDFTIFKTEQLQYVINN